MSVRGSHRGASVASRLAKARVRCEAAGLRWTPVRARALELLLAADGPVKAYDLMANFKQEAATAPPTVYRALEALARARLAHRIASLNAYVACSCEARDHVASFLICDDCGAVEEVATEASPLLAAIAEAGGFETQSLTVEARGRCLRCQVA